MSLLSLRDIAITGALKLLGPLDVENLLVEYINGLNKEELGNLKGLVSNLQTQLEELESNMGDVETDRTEFKRAIANAIKGKEPDSVLTENSKTSDFVNDISKIETGKDVSAVTAGAEDVLEGKLIVDKNGNQVAGSIPTRAYTVQAQKTYPWDNKLYMNFLSGYYRGTQLGGVANTSETWRSFADVASALGLTAAKLMKGQTVCGVAGTGTGDANAAASQILSGKTAYVNGSKVTGNMPDYTGVPNHIRYKRIANNRVEFAVDGGYHGCYWAGNSYEYMEYSEMASLLGITASKILSGNTICGVVGSGSARHQVNGIGSISSIAKSGSRVISVPSPPAGTLAIIIDLEGIRIPIAAYESGRFTYHKAINIYEKWKMGYDLGSTTYLGSSNDINQCLSVTLYNKGTSSFSASYCNFWYYF